MLVYSGEFS